MYNIIQYTILHLHLHATGPIETPSRVNANANAIVLLLYSYKLFESISFLVSILSDTKCDEKRYEIMVMTIFIKFYIYTLLTIGRHYFIEII